MHFDVMPVNDAIVFVEYNLTFHDGLLLKPYGAC
jgi:hypothetical protein